MSKRDEADTRDRVQAAADFGFFVGENGTGHDAPPDLYGDEPELRAAFLAAFEDGAAWRREKDATDC